MVTLTSGMVNITMVVVMLGLLAPAMGADCRWNKDTEFPPEYPPLLMSLEPWISILPSLESDERVVRVSEGTEFLLACPETTVAVLNAEVVPVTCVGGTTVLADGQEYPLSELGCARRPRETLSKSKTPCGEGGQRQAIGFDVVGYGFYELIEICFDPVQESNLYSTHTVRGAHIAAGDVNPDRPSFKSDSGFYSVSVSTCYEQKSQIQMMEDILGDSSLIDVDQNLYFARGHMSPDADFVTEQEMDATYYYINAAPQWQVFNNGNWKMVEMDVRTLAEARASNLTVWSGAWDVLQLDDTNSNPVDIFLGLAQGQSVIPAPDITWKVVYDPATDEAAAIVGVNNPYVPVFPTPLCGSAQVCAGLSWLTLDFGALGIGATYCCTVQELNSVIPNVPDLGTATLLT